MHLLHSHKGHDFHTPNKLYLLHNKATYMIKNCHIL